MVKNNDLNGFDLQYEELVPPKRRTRSAKVNSKNSTTKSRVDHRRSRVGRVNTQLTGRLRKAVYRFLVLVRRITSETWSIINSRIDQLIDRGKKK